MKFTQAQVREITGLTEPTLRVWARCVAPLVERKGKGPKFSVGDVVALLVIESAVKQLGCPISSLAPLAPALFSACTQFTANGASGGCVVVKGEAVIILASGEAVPVGGGDPAFVVVPVGPALARVSGWMSQGQLSLPL